MTPAHYDEVGRSCRLGPARELLHESGAVLQSTHDYGLIEQQGEALSRGLLQDLRKLLQALPRETVAVPLRRDLACPPAGDCPEDLEIVVLRETPVLLSRAPGPALAWLAGHATAIGRELLEEDTLRSLGRPRDAQSPEPARRRVPGGLL